MSDRKTTFLEKQDVCLPLKALIFYFFPFPTAIVGPPRLSWLLQDQILSVNIITPLTPYQRRTGSYKPVDRVLLKLWYWLQLYEGDLLIQQVCGSWAGPRGAGLAQAFLVQQSHCLRLQWCERSCAAALPTPGCHAGVRCSAPPIWGSHLSETGDPFPPLGKKKTGSVWMKGDATNVSGDPLGPEHLLGQRTEWWRCPGGGTMGKVVF